MLTDQTCNEMARKAEHFIQRVSIARQSYRRIIMRDEWDQIKQIMRVMPTICPQQYCATVVLPHTNAVTAWDDHTEKRYILTMMTLFDRRPVTTSMTEAHDVMVKMRQECRDIVAREE